MMAHAEALEFEQAAELRNQIGALSRVLHQQSVEDNTGARDKDVDILAVKVQGGRPASTWRWCAAAATWATAPYFPSARRGRDRGRGDAGRRRPRRPRASSRSRCRCSRPSSRSTTSTCRVPPLLVLSHAVDQRADRGAGASRPACASTAQHQPREQRRIWLEMAQQGRRICSWRGCWPRKARSRRARARWSRRWTSRVDDLDAFRIECFDISHTAGEATQASCVVFEHHTDAEPRSTAATTSTASRRGDDYAAMRQVLMRRYAKLAEARGAQGDRRACPTWCWSTAAAARSRWRARCSRSSGSTSSLIVGVEKGEGRKVGLEELVFADGRAEGLPRPRLGGADAGGADPRRGAPLRHHRHARPARQRAHRRQPAGGHRRRRAEEARAAAAALRRRARRRPAPASTTWRRSKASRASWPRRSTVRLH